MKAPGDDQDNHSSAKPSSAALSDQNNALVADLKEFELAKQKCPAFTARAQNDSDASGTEVRSSSCPFSQATTPEQIKETLLQLPPSHLDREGLVYKSLEHFHSSRMPGTSPSSILSGGCPVKNVFLTNSAGAPVSFHQAMEGFSLAAIMARMATEFEASEHGEDSSESGSEAGDGRHQLDSVETTTPLQSGIASGQTIHSSSLPNDHRHHQDTASIGDASSTASTVPASPPPTSTMEGKTSGTRTSLSEALKSGTAISHQRAEDVHFVKNFIRGKIDRDLYSQLIVNLYHVYRELEIALDQHAPSHFGSCHFPKELYRTDALKEDLDFWYTTQANSSNSDEEFVAPPISPATQDYIDRIRHCAQHQPLTLLAHAYTRYLGDLSGGKVLARVARRALGLDKNGDGLAFYQFEHVPSAKLFKDMYRNVLNALELSDRDITNLVREANVAFGLNVRIFQELDVQGSVPGAVVSPLDDILQFEKLDVAHHSSASGDAKECPFIVGKNATKTTESAVGMVKHSSSGCPWPFVFFHDPATGMRCWQTWLVLGLFVSWIYNEFLSES